MNKIYIFINICIVILLGYSCKSRNMSVYRHYPKGTVLNHELIEKANQVYDYEGQLFLLMPHRLSDFDTDYYLLYFDNTKTLAGACHLSFSGIKSIDKGIISHYETSMLSKPNYCKCDLSNGFKLEPIGGSAGNGATQNKLIKEFEFFTDNKTSQVKIVFWRGEKTYYRDTKELSIGKLSLDSMHLNLSDIYKSDESLYFVKIEDKFNTIDLDHFLFVTENKRQEFLDSYMARMLNGHKLD